MMLSSVDSAVADDDSATVDLHLAFKLSGENRTFINRQFSRYPFHVCRAQYLDHEPRGMATIYLQSSAGGIFESDRLSCEIIADRGAQAHITTQASTIVHSMHADRAEQSVLIRAEQNSCIEYLPDPLILFPEARLNSRVCIQRHPQSVVLLSDGFFRHDPKLTGGSFGQFHSEVSVYDYGGGMLCLDRYSVSGAEFSSGTPGIMGQSGVQTTFFILVNSARIDRILDGLESVLKEVSEVYAGISRLPNNCGILLRAIAEEGFIAKQLLIHSWALVRNILFGRPPLPRRK